MTTSNCCFNHVVEDLLNLVQTLEFAPRFVLSITSHGWVKQPDCCSSLVFYTRGFVIFGFDNLLSHLRKSQSPLKASVLYIIKIDGGRPKKPLHESFKGHMILKGAEKLAPLSLCIMMTLCLGLL